MEEEMNLIRGLVIGMGVLGVAAGARAQLGESNVLLVYNSKRAESLAVRDMYVLARPGVHEFDLNTTALGVAGVSRAVYVSHIRNPVQDFINGTVTGNDLSQQIMAIVTTRGMPSRINGTDEFLPQSTWSSVESELSLLQQDMEQTGVGVLGFRYSGVVDNPYHRRLNQPITGFTRANVQTPRSFTFVSIPAWSVSGLGSGDIYLVCRLDAAPTDLETPEEVDALIYIQMLIDRSQDLEVPRCGVQSLLDEDATGGLDDDAAGALFPADNDFGDTRILLTDNGFQRRHDVSSDFVEGHELVEPLRQMLVLGTYGENHDINGPANGEDPPGGGTYTTGYRYHPAASFHSIESFNGNSIVNGVSRQNHGQVLDVISAGASFAIGNVREPFSVWVPDMRFYVENLYVNGLTWAEAAYSSLPALSWQQVVIGDPLARVTVIDQNDLDRDTNGAIDLADLYHLGGSAVDMDCDSDIDRADTQELQFYLRADESADVTS
jgi:hypothetical protein